MPLLFKIFFIILSSVFCLLGLLLLVSPLKYQGLASESVMRRETTERGKRLAVRMQGLATLTVGAFFALFVWAVM